MKKALTALFALALVAGAAAGCTDSNQSGKVGENPSQQPPAASPSTDSGSTLGSAPGSSWRPGRQPHRRVEDHAAAHQVNLASHLAAGSHPRREAFRAAEREPSSQGRPARVTIDST